jgi:DNA-directed RNA polymerase subunit RPC12/RpoP
MIEAVLHCPKCGKKQIHRDEIREYLKCECSRCGTRFLVDTLCIETEDDEYE